MYRFLWAIAVGLALAACAALAGCSGHSWGGGGHSAGEATAGGLTVNYTIRHLTYDGRVYFVLAADGCSGGGSGSGPTARGQLYAVDGRKIPWSCTTTDGKNGTATIDGQQFDLAKGAFFIVSAKENKTKLEQLTVDMSKLQGDPVHEKVQSMADTEPRIAAFFKVARGDK
jgi:hypothetical protein